MWFLRMIFKKRFGPRTFVDYLHLPQVYSVGTTAKKKQQVTAKGYDTVIGKQSKADYQKLQKQKKANSGRFFAYNYEAGRNMKFTAKPTPPLATSTDPFMSDWDRHATEDMRKHFYPKSYEFKRARTAARKLVRDLRARQAQWQRAVHFRKDKTRTFRYSTVHLINFWMLDGKVNKMRGKRTIFTIGMNQPEK